MTSLALMFVVDACLLKYPDAVLCGVTPPAGTCATFHLHDLVERS